MPSPFDRIIGNRHVADALRIAVEAAQAEGRMPRHVLLSGPPGTGKTKFSETLAEAIGGALRRIHGPAIQRGRSGDLISAMITLEPGDVLFIDEIHALPHEAMECLYEGMEQRQVSITAPAEGGGVRIMTIPLNAFTLVAATTNPGKLSEPLRDRFDRHLILNEYSVDELTAILHRGSAEQRGRLSQDDCREIAMRSRGRVRNALALMRVCLDHIISGGCVEDAFRESGLGPTGETRDDRHYLLTLERTFGGGPAGLDALISASGLPRETVEQTVEPFLLSRGIITRTPRGRALVHPGGARIE